MELQFFLVYYLHILHDRIVALSWMEAQLQSYKCLEKMLVVNKCWFLLYLTFCQSNLCKIICNHYFYIYIHISINHISSVRNTSIINENINLSRNFCCCFYFRLKRVHICDVQWQNYRWISWHCLKLNRLMKQKFTEKVC